MRTLITKDIFAAARILKASGVREEMKKIVTRLVASGEKDTQSIGIEGMLVIIESLADAGAEKQIYEFLAGPLEMTPEEVAGLGIDEFADYVKEIANQNDLQHFFSSVSVILGKT